MRKLFLLYLFIQMWRRQKTCKMSNLRLSLLRYTITLINNVSWKRFKKKRMSFKIEEQKKRENLKILSTKKLMKRLQKAEKMKNNVLTTRRLSSENVKMMTKTKKIKKRVIINEIFASNIVSFIYIMRRTFEMLIYNIRVVDVQTINQQKTIRKIEKQNEILHSKLKIVKII